MADLTVEPESMSLAEAPTTKEADLSEATKKELMQALNGIEWSSED